jgi:hypothetical protein
MLNAQRQTFNSERRVLALTPPVVASPFYEGEGEGEGSGWAAILEPLTSILSPGEGERRSNAS